MTEATGMSNSTEYETTVQINQYPKIVIINWNPVFSHCHMTTDVRRGIWLLDGRNGLRRQVAMPVNGNLARWVTKWWAWGKDRGWSKCHQLCPDQIWRNCQQTSGGPCHWESRDTTGPSTMRASIDKQNQSLHKELILRIQGTQINIQVMKMLTEETRHSHETWLAEVKAQEECGGCRETITDADRIKPSWVNGSITSLRLWWSTQQLQRPGESHTPTWPPERIDH
jgi:hypothetical protein